MSTLPRTGWLATINVTLGTVTLGTATLLLPAAAEAVTLSSLAPGSTYRYVFTTSGTRDATSTDISVYNSFVTSQAAQNSALAAVAFNAIASTSTVNAIDNVSCGAGCDSAPIFTLDGNEVAGSLAQLFSGSILSTLAVNQFGSSNNAYVFTGSQSNGTRSDNVLGSSNFTDLGETYDGPSYYINSGSFTQSYQSFNFYGLSGALQVAGATAVPEPASLALLGAGLVGAGVLRRRRKA